MKRLLGIPTVLASLALLGGRLPDALAQGLPAPGPGGPALPAAEGGTLIGPVIVLVLGLFGALALIVAIADLRRKRRAEGIAIEGQISDALMREPRLTGSVLTPIAHVPMTSRTAPSVEIRGQVEYPDLREIAVRIVRQELIRYHPDGQVEDRIFVSPPVPAGRH
jgi:hypothetical protein